jgi:hypothetical protein
MAKEIKGLNYAASAIVVLLLALAFVSNTGSVIGTAVAQTDATRPHLLRGQISSVQLDSDKNPDWIQSGIWVMRVTPAATDSELPRVHLIVRMAMVMTDGTAMHSHTITNFVITGFSVEGNTTDVFEGTATVAMRDGPVSDVPVTIKIFNNAVIGIWIGPDMVDSHFGEGPVYGTLSVLARAVAEQMRDRMMMMGNRPMMS